MPNQDVSEISLARLIGASGESVQWARALAFFVALLVSVSVVMVLNDRLHYPVSDLPRQLFDSLVDTFAVVDLHDSLWVLSVITNPLILTICALVAFRFVRSVGAAALVAALGYTAIQFPLRLFYVTHYPGARSPSMLLLLSWGRFAWAFLFLIALSLALRWVKPVWLALGLGAAVADGVQVLIFETGVAVDNLNISYAFNFVLREESMRALFVMLSAALFAGVFWIGLKVANAERGRLSKAFHLGSIAGGLGLSEILLLFAWNDTLENGPNNLAQSLVYPAVFSGLFSAVVLLILVYKMWAAIQDGHVRTTPSMAVILLFVPFFSFYWIFQVFWGFARDYNGYLSRHTLTAPRLPAGFFLACTILPLACFIPVAGPFLLGVDFFMTAIMVSKICDAVNALPTPEVGVVLSPSVAA
jgi:hypothetical protein